MNNFCKYNILYNLKPKDGHETLLMQRLRHR